MESKFSISIIGASGYTGLELIKILINHPYFDLKGVFGSEESGKVDEVHPALKSIVNLPIKKADIKEIVKISELVFLALPHKSAMSFAKELLKEGVKVVDLSADYRLELETYEKFYCAHEDRENLQKAVYGLPEFYREEIKKASLVANPGCYPTASLLALLPFVDFIDENYPIFIDAKSGVSGAGKKCSLKTHFVAINENIFVYNPLSHRHAPEIKEKVLKLKKKDLQINFVPQLLPISRGMLVNVYAILKEEIDVFEYLKNFYKDEKFVRVRENPVDVKSTAGTNFCDLFVKRDKKSLFISSSIDNLLRGASSQAVVNANLMCGFREDLAIPKVAYVP